MKKPRGKAVKPLMSQLAVGIVDRVRSEAMPAGAHLAEQALADAFHVSRGPVREALTILEREGIVLFHPNRGFFLTRPPGRYRLRTSRPRYPPKRRCITALPKTVSGENCTVIFRKRN